MSMIDPYECVFGDGVMQKAAVHRFGRNYHKSPLEPNNRLPCTGRALGGPRLSFFFSYSEKIKLTNDVIQ